MNVFVVHVPFHYYLFRSIYSELEDSHFIIPPFSDSTMSEKYGSGMSGRGLYDYLHRFLEGKGVDIIDYGDINNDNFITFITKNVRNVICPHHFNSRYEVQDTRIFQMVYAIPVEAKDSQLSFDYNFITDLILTYGPEAVDRLEKKGLVAIAVGNPLFDFWFNNQIDELSLELIKNKLLKDAPTILYLPTHSYYSSIDQFDDSIIALAKKYNVIVKLHHMTFNGEANRLCKFISHPEIITLGDFFDPLVLHNIADIVLSDTSGTLFDRLLIRKPVIMLVNSLLKYKVDILTPDNKDASVENSGLFPYTENPNYVEALIGENLNKNIQVSDDLLYSLFYMRDGLAGERIANTILDETKYPMVSTLDKYERAIGNAPDEDTKKFIIEKRNYFKNKYHHLPIKKPSLLKRVLNRLSFG